MAVSDSARSELSVYDFEVHFIFYSPKTSAHWCELKLRWIIESRDLSLCGFPQVLDDDDALKPSMREEVNSKLVSLPNACMSLRKRSDYKCTAYGRRIYGANW